MAIREIATRLVGKDTEELFADMGKTWDWLLADPQLRWYALTLLLPICPPICIA